MKYIIYLIVGVLIISIAYGTPLYNDPIILRDDGGDSITVNGTQINLTNNVGMNLGGWNLVTGTAASNKYSTDYNGTDGKGMVLSAVPTSGTAKSQYVDFSCDNCTATVIVYNSSILDGEWWFYANDFDKDFVGVDIPDNDTMYDSVCGETNYPITNNPVTMQIKFNGWRAATNDILINYLINNISVCNNTQSRNMTSIGFYTTDRAGYYPTIYFDNLVVNTTTYNYYIDNCRKKTNTTAYNITFYNHDGTFTKVNVSARLQYGVGNNLINFSNRSTFVYNYSYCIFPEEANYTTSLSLEYKYAGSVMTHYTSDTIFNKTNKNVALYVDSGTAVTATVYDNVNNKVEDAYIHVQRYDLGTNTYKLVGIYKTNSNGEAKLYITLNSVYYRFLIYYPITTLKKSTTPDYVYSSSIEFQIDTYQPVLEDYYTSQGIDSSLTYNNATNNFRFIFSDTSGSISQGCLKLWRTTAKANTLLNTSCLSGTSGTILLPITPTNDTSYMAKAYVTISGSDNFLHSLTKTFFGSNITSMMGLVVVFIMTILFAFLFKFSIPLGIIALPIPTVLASATKLIQVDWRIAAGVQVGALILAIFINDRR